MEFKQLSLRLKMRFDELELDSTTRAALRSMLRPIRIIAEGTTNKDIIMAKIKEVYSTYIR